MLRRTAAAIAALLCGFAGSAAALEWKLVARGSDPALGLPGDPSFGQLVLPDRLGPDEVYFRALVTNGPPAQLGGMYAWSDESGSELLLPFGGGTGHGDPRPLALDIDGEGDVAIADSDLEPVDCEPTGAYAVQHVQRVSRAGDIETVAETGSPVGGSDLAFAGFGWTSPVGIRKPYRPLAISDVGALAFAAELATDPCGERSQALVASTPIGVSSLVAIAGEPAPTRPAGPSTRSPSRLAA
jgi:hypothetical protein